ncbi:unnamed protein product [Pleuronectes platessa]|uniref:Uncharacterized protein n=1 Tax=Pleuronectes platessa TaxID=8262 RepID=A0A9N7TXN7_PLEPL|nr:unnamed protein product [Pleuronectes platessa]
MWPHGMWTGGARDRTPNILISGRPARPTECKPPTAQRATPYASGCVHTPPPDVMTLPRPCTIARCSHNTSPLRCFPAEAESPTPPHSIHPGTQLSAALKTHGGSRLDIFPVTSQTQALLRFDMWRSSHAHRPTYCCSAQSRAASSFLSDSLQSPRDEHRKEVGNFVRESATHMINAGVPTQEVTPPSSDVQNSPFAEGERGSYCSLRREGELKGAVELAGGAEVGAVGVGLLPKTTRRRGSQTQSISVRLTVHFWSPASA